MAHCAKAVDLGLSVTPWDGLRQGDRVVARMCMEAATADMRAKLTRLRSENEALKEALRAAYVELAALIPIPSADDPEWPMFPLNAADHECLNNAYLGIRAALQETSNG